MISKTGPINSQPYPESSIVPPPGTSVAKNGAMPGSATPTFMEFFSGIGLVRVALEREHARCVFANDIDEVKSIVYRANFANDHLFVGSIETIRGAQLPYADIATASFPCINLSQAGPRDGLHGQHSGMVWEFVRLMKELKELGRAPRALLLENVPGILTAQAGAAFGELLLKIASLGYTIDLIQIDARHFLPQSRNRVFILAVAAECSHPHVEPESALSHPMRRHNISKVVERYRALPWRFFDFPEAPIRKVTFEQVVADPPNDDPAWWSPARLEKFWSQLERLRVDHEALLKGLLVDGCTRHLTAVRRGRRRHQREQVINLRTDGLASCLRTPKGGSSIQLVVCVRDGAVRVRRMSGLEYARLQGVGLPKEGDRYVLPEREVERLNAFGDAVCVPVVRWVYRNSIRHLWMSDQTRVEQRGPIQVALPGMRLMRQESAA